MKEKILAILQKYNHDRSRLLDILLDIQEMQLHIPEDAIGIIGELLNISKVDVEQCISFYHFLTFEPVGKYAVYLNDSAVANMKGRAEVADAFED